MSELTLQVLKYVAAALTVGIAFAGSWFFEFTKTDPNRGKRSLTPWGQRAIVFAIISLICAGIATVWSDILSGQKSTEATAALADEKMKTAAERREAKSYREKVEAGQTTTNGLFAIINENITKLSPQDAAKVRTEIGKLQTADDFKRDYPDLFKQIAAAKSLSDFEGPAQKAYAAKIAERVSNDPSCQNIKLNKWSDTPVRTGSFFLYDPDHKQKGSLDYMVDVNHVSFAVEILAIQSDINQGYSFVFLDSSVSPKLYCKETKLSAICRDNTEDSSYSLNCPAVSAFGQTGH